MSPHDGPTSTTRGALLLIDFQHDFLDPQGRLPVAAHHVEPMLRAAHQAIADLPPGDLEIKVANAFPASAKVANLMRRNAAIVGSPGAAWDPRVDADGAHELPKWKGDAFCNPELQRALDDHRISQLAVAGLYARGCLAATVRSALRRGFAVDVIADAVACRSDATRRRALTNLQARGARLV